MDMGSLEEHLFYSTDQSVIVTVLQKAFQLLVAILGCGVFW